MNYQIDITGMHCTGCVGLIQLSLEDVGLSDVIADLDHNTVRFTTELDQGRLVELLNRAFTELPNYRFSNLQIIN